MRARAQKEDRGKGRAKVGGVASHRSKEREGPGGEMLRHLGRKNAENSSVGDPLGGLVETNLAGRSEQHGQPEKGAPRARENVGRAKRAMHRYGASDIG